MSGESERVRLVEALDAALMHLPHGHQARVVLQAEHDAALASEPAAPGEGVYGPFTPITARSYSTAPDQPQDSRSSGLAHPLGAQDGPAGSAPTQQPDAAGDKLDALMAELSGGDVWSVERRAYDALAAHRAQPQPREEDHAG